MQNPTLKQIKKQQQQQNTAYVKYQPNLRFLDSFCHLFSQRKVFTKDITVYFLPDSMATKLAAHKPHQKKKNLRDPQSSEKQRFQKMYCVVLL